LSSANEIAHFAVGRPSKTTGCWLVRLSAMRDVRAVGPEQAEQTAQKVLADWGQLLRLSLHSVEYPRPAQRGLPD
jgi:uncharacterized heparinase superfamily protein